MYWIFEKFMSCCICLFVFICCFVSEMMLGWNLESSFMFECVIEVILIFFGVFVLFEDFIECVCVFDEIEESVYIVRDVMIVKIEF